MAKKKGTNGYVAEINKMLRQEFGEVPAKLSMLVRKTAQDMRILDRIIEELDGKDDLTTIEVGSMGQQKTTINPLLATYEKQSARVTDDLYNLGLTSRKAALKSDDTNPNEKKPIDEYIASITD